MNNERDICYDHELLAYLQFGVEPLDNDALMRVKKLARFTRWRSDRGL